MRDLWLGLGFVLALTFGGSVSTAAAAEAQNFTLRNINGQQVSLSQFKGQVVFISFWATTCAPCKVEMVHLQELYNELQAKGFVVLSISTDDARYVAQVKPFIKKNAYTFPVLLDTESKVIAAFNPNKGLPFALLLDKSGTVVKQYAGYNPGDEVQVRKDIEGLIGS